MNRIPQNLLILLKPARPASCATCMSQFQSRMKSKMAELLQNLKPEYAMSIQGPGKVTRAAAKKFGLDDLAADEVDLVKIKVFGPKSGILDFYSGGKLVHQAIKMGQKYDYIKQPACTDGYHGIGARFLESLRSKIRGAKNA